jgi:hypothetical protein
MQTWLFKIFTNENDNKLDPTTKHLIGLLINVVGAIVFIIVALLAFNIFGHWKTDPFNLGTFGDFFGGVLNPLLTFLTVLGLAVSIIMQRISLSALRLQGFETTFFNLLDLHGKIVEGLMFSPDILKDSAEMLYLKRHLPEIIENEPAPAKGREVFAAVLHRIAAVASENRTRVSVYRNELQVHHNDILGHYFRNLYQILRLIERLEGERIDRTTIRTYTGIVRAQLSANELALLFYNCLSGTVDDGEFQKLIVKYQILEHLPLQYDVVLKTFTSELLPQEFKYFQEYLILRLPNDPLSIAETNNIPGPYSPGAYGKNPAVHKYLLDAQLPILPWQKPRMR